ncbi:MAG TPA: TrmH family RNA methyltransferase [Sphingomonas sp.]|nr:TrmH family RNA methyltransferase [Sphingomonas sp.]
MAFWTYILRCADGSYHVGHTDTLEMRIAQHQAGDIEGYTHTRRPVTLEWSQDFPSRIEALEAERQIKGWTRRKKEALIRGDWADLHDAAIPPGERGLRLRSGRTEKSDDPVRAERSRSAVAPPPVFVLVRPQLGENIGKAARAMLNFGLAEMRLVSPRDGWPNPSAGPAASGAGVVLERAQVFGSVAEAVADCAHVYATTVRKRGVTKPVLTPEAASREIHGQQGRSAILFGPERSGLETDDVALARAIVTVPINPEFGSLNLAQAVILVAYEWSKGMALASPPETELDPPAPQGEFDGMMTQLETMLDGAGFFHPPERTPATKRTLRTMLTKPGWSSQEIRTLRGVLSALGGAKRRRG